MDGWIGSVAHAGSRSVDCACAGPINSLVSWLVALVIFVSWSVLCIPKIVVGSIEIRDYLDQIPQRERMETFEILIEISRSRSKENLRSTEMIEIG